MKIPLCTPDIGEKELKAAAEVLKSGWLADGPKSKEFEEKFAKYIGTKHAITLNSCTSALFLALKAQGIVGDVIMPSFTFVASANAAVTAGAQPIFADVDYDTCNIDIDKLQEMITPATEAIMPVHYAGQSANMKAIMDIAEDNDLKVIEDSAETIGGTFAGKKTGTFGVGCFSFYPTKNIATGEGGMVTTDDEKLAKDISRLKAHGVDKSAYEREQSERPWYRAATAAGYNFRMPDVLAAIGAVQMEKIDEMNDKRRAHAQYLTKNLVDDNIDVPVETKDCKHVYQMYTIKVKGIDRNSFVKALRKEGIGASVHFDPPVHKQPYYLAFRKGTMDVTEKVAESIVTLPMFPSLTREELDFIIETVEKTVNSLK